MPEADGTYLPDTAGDQPTPDPVPEGPPPLPLACPAEGVPDVSITVDEIARAADQLARGSGPFAVDAERASGFRYSNRAYLIQIRRHGAGTVLIDPVNHGGSPLDVLKPLSDVLADDEWILHAADQDLPCLAEVGLHPPALYDTELAGRLAGFERVNLAAMVERLLGLGLAKGHGAADWSVRPLPANQLRYAVLDVEFLVELRNALHAALIEDGKWDWAEQEFTSLLGFRPRERGDDAWRKTSGIHGVRKARNLAVVRELWRERVSTWRAAWQYLVLGALGMLVCGAWVYKGAQTTSAINIALIYAASPVLIALGAVLWLGERFSWRQAIGVLIAMSGVFHVVVKGQWLAIGQVQWVAGDGWIVLCMVAWAGYALLLRKWPSPLSATARLAATAVGGSVALLPFATLEWLQPDRPAWSALATALVVGAALIPGIGAYWDYGFCQKVLGASRVAARRCRLSSIRRRPFQASAPSMIASTRILVRTSFQRIERPLLLLIGRVVFWFP
jgi:drug/metabolite transporter (DMT)-like permease